MTAKKSIHDYSLIGTWFHVFSLIFSVSALIYVLYAAGEINRNLEEIETNASLVRGMTERFGNQLPPLSSGVAEADGVKGNGEMLYRLDSLYSYEEGPGVYRFRKVVATDVITLIYKGEKWNLPNGSRSTWVWRMRHPEEVTHPDRYDFSFRVFSDPIDAADLAEGK